MSEMVERVARAIFEDEYREPNSLRPDYTIVDNYYRRTARAAIQAMREPTDEMESVGFNAAHQYCFEGDPPDFKEGWRAMIAAALKGSGADA